MYSQSLGKEKHMYNTPRPNKIFIDCGSNYL